MMIQMLKNHKWAVILALAAVIITVSPQVYFRYDHQDIYQGIELIGGTEKMPRVREVQDGHLPPTSSPYLKEGKEDPYIRPPLNAIIIGYLGKVFSLDFNNTILLSRLLFPFLLFLIIYGFVFLLSQDKLAALTSSLMIFLGRELISRNGFWQLWQGAGGDDFLPFFRPVVSSLIALFFFAFLLFFWLFWERRQWRWGILSLAVLGTTFYEYFYTWTFLYAFLGAFLLILVWLKRWSDFKRILLIFWGGALMGIPYFWNLYQASLHPNYQEVTRRYGLIESRQFLLGFLVFLVLAVFLLFFPRKWRERYYFCLALLMAPFIALNQQLITGKMVQSGHYHWHFHIPLAIIFLLVIFFAWVSGRKWSFFRKASAVFLIGINFYAGIFFQSVSYTAVENEMVENQRYGPVMDWLNQNARKDEVVFANADTSHLVVIYTPLNVFYHLGEGINCLAVSHQRALDALFSFYRLKGVKKEEAQKVFFEDRGEISHRVYGLYYRELTGSYKGIPDEKIQEIVQKYRESFSVSDSEFLRQIFDQYQVKYAVWDKKQDPAWQLDRYPFLKKRAEIGDFILYENFSSHQ